MSIKVKRIKTNVAEEELKAGTQILASIVLDNSISMRSFIAAVLSSLKVCKETMMAAKDPIQLSYVTFDSEIAVNAFQYVEDIDDYIYSANGTTTRFYDAAYIAAEDMKSRLQLMNCSYGGKGGIIIITDGVDNDSMSDSRKKAIETFKEIKNLYNVPIIVGLLGKKEAFKELMSFCDECGAIWVELNDVQRLKELMKLFSSSMSTGNLKQINNKKALEEMLG